MTGTDSPTHPADLSALAARVAPADLLAVEGDAAVVVSGVTHDSRLVVPGTLFACARGERHDGHAFAAEAVAAGAAALLVDHHLDLDVAQIVVRDVRAAMGWVAAAAYGDPSRSLTVIGITGTNGKTTTAHLLASIMRQADLTTPERTIEVIGTLSGARTTPEAPELQQRLAAIRDSGRTTVVMEVSSHALALHRVDGTRFSAAVFTNLGRDHLDLHGSIEDYFRAKASLFTEELTDVGITNIDDPRGRLLLDAADIEMVPFSQADASDVVVGPTWLAFTWREVRVELGLGGAFNVMNALAAATTASRLGIEADVIAAGLAAAGPVRGRFEAVEAGQPFTVVVDYAHTPDGLASLLAAARGVTPRGRVLLAFGCGGDRDRAKRPQMGAVAAELADRVVVTSDNPRSEDPLAIIGSIAGGIDPGYRDRVVLEPDRRTAIATLLEEALPGDTVVIAGKGHETTQTIGDEVLPFDDRAVARELLEGRS